MHGRSGRSTRSGLAAAAMLAILAVGLVSVAPAGAAPGNKNTVEYHWTCDGGLAFTTVTISHNLAVAAQVTTGEGQTFVFKRIVSDDGTVYYNVPGWADKPTIDCTAAEIPGFTFTGFLTPVHP
jgi:hypothetical protein